MPDSVFKQCLDTVVTTIQNLNLTNIQDDEIFLKKTPFEDGVVNRGITISWEPELEAPGAISEDDIGYPIVVTMVQGTAKGGGEDMDLISLWRQTIRRAFIHKRIAITGVAGSLSITAHVGHRQVSLPKSYRSQYDAGQMVILIWVREGRT